MEEPRVRFKSTLAQDVKVGDVEMILDEQKRKVLYYYYRAESVFVGDKEDPIHDPMTGAFVANRITNCVEIKWTPINDKGKPFITRYHPLAILDIASDVTDTSKLIQEEDTEGMD